MSYANTHTSALATVTRKGAAVTFTYTTSTYTAATDTTSSPVTVTMTGAAVEVKGNPVEYQALGLIQTEKATLLFTPTTYGDEPPLGSTVSWGGITYTVKSVNGLSPDGTSILSSVVIAR